MRSAYSNKLAGLKKVFALSAGSAARCAIAALIVLFLFPPPHASAQGKTRYLGMFAVAGPVALASDGESRLYVACADGKVRVLDFEGREVGSIGGRDDARWDGVLYEPSGIMYYDGRLYVVDKWLNHIVVMTPLGRVLDVIGSGGSGKKQFNEPSGVFVRGGLIYVADTGNARVQVLGPNGVYLGEIGLSVREAVRLRRPVDVVVDHRGLVYVVDAESRSVKLYNQDGAYISYLGRLRSPGALALSGEGVLVTDPGAGHIRRFIDFNRSDIFFGPWGRDSSEFVEMRGIVDTGQMVYVADRLGNNIKYFSLTRRAPDIPDSGLPMRHSARYLANVPAPGLSLGKVAAGSGGELYLLDRKGGGIYTAGHGAMQRMALMQGGPPVSFALGHGGELYLLDSVGLRVDVLSPQGHGLRGVSLKAARDITGKLMDIAVSAAGDVYIADSGAGAVHVFDPQGGYRGRLGRGGTSVFIEAPVSLAAGEDGLIYVADARTMSVLVYSYSGRFVKRIPGVATGSPVSLAVGEGDVVVLDSEPPYIKVFGPEGGLIMSFGATGSAMGDIEGASSVTVLSGGRIAVSDTGNGRVQEFGLSLTEHLSPPEVDGRLKGRNLDSF